MTRGPVISPPVIAQLRNMRNTATSKAPPPWRADKRKTAERGYGARWQRARAQYLSLHPLCVMCQPRVVLATVVDHRTPHKGDEVLFWDQTNWQALCSPHHNGTKQAL